MVAYKKGTTITDWSVVETKIKTRDMFDFFNMYINFYAI